MEIKFSIICCSNTRTICGRNIRQIILCCLKEKQYLLSFFYKNYRISLVLYGPASRHWSHRSENNILYPLDKHQDLHWHCNSNSIIKKHRKTLPGGLTVSYNRAKLIEIEKTDIVHSVQSFGVSSCWFIGWILK